MTRSDRIEASGNTGGVFAFLWANKLWWMIPLLVVGLVAIVLVVLHFGFGISPFVYPM
jgi:hypothetical protein